MPGAGLRERWDWRGKGEWVNFFFMQLWIVWLAPVPGRVTAVEPSKKTALKEEKWGTAEGKEKREIIMKSWVLPGRQVLILGSKAGSRQKGWCTTSTAWNMADRVRWRGRNKKGAFIWDQTQGRDFRKSWLQDLRQEWGWAGPWTIQHHLNTKFPSECWERNSKPCPGDEAKYCGKRSAHFLSPSSQQSLFLLGLLQKTLDESLVGNLSACTDNSLHLFMSTSKDILFHATLPPTLCNQYIGANLSKFSLSWLTSCGAWGACYWTSQAFNLPTGKIGKIKSIYNSEACCKD